MSTPGDVRDGLTSGSPTREYVCIGTPAGTPQAIVDRLNAEVNKIVKDKEFAEKLVSLGFQPVGGSAADMKQAIVRDRAKWKAVIEAQGIRAE